MSLSHGMNIDDVEALGKRLQQHFAERLRSIGSEVEGLVQNSQGSWIGPDAEAFRSWWPNKRSVIAAAADDIHGFGQAALNNAEEQRTASDASAMGGSVGGNAGRPPIGSNRLDSREARQAVLDHEAKWLDAAGGWEHFPDAMQIANDWHAELMAGDPTPEQVAGFESYMAMVKLANQQRIVVQNAAEHAFEQFEASAEAGASAFKSGAGMFGEGGGLPDDAGEFAKDVLFEALNLGGDYIGGEIIDGPVDGLKESAVGMIMDQYTTDANASLVHLEEHFRNTDTVGHGDPSDLANAQYDRYDDALSLAKSDADRADAFTPITGDGSLVDGALRGSLKVMTGGTAAKILDGMEVVGGGAKAAYHFNSATDALYVALNGTDSLFEAANLITSGSRTVSP